MPVYVFVTGDPNDPPGKLLGRAAGKTVEEAYNKMLNENEKRYGKDIADDIRESAVKAETVYGIEVADGPWGKPRIMKM